MRHGEAPQAFQAPVDVHASADGQVYLFRGRRDETETSSEDEEFNVTELRSRAFFSQEQKSGEEWLMLERRISHEDNLNKLALQYGCKVADIKQVNNLIKEQDLYALKSIKIPVKKHGLLTETNFELQAPEDRAPCSPPPCADKHQPVDEAEAKFSSQIPKYMDFFKEVDDHIECLIQNADTQTDSLTLNSDRTRRCGSRGHRLRNHGADWGIRWWNAVIAMLLIGIVLPIFYVVYFTTQGSGNAVTNSTVVNMSKNDVP